MKKKLFARKGFTLTEVLIAVALLSIFVSMAAVGTSALFGTGEQMMEVSKAAVLGADVLDIITNELRFGEKFEEFTTSTDKVTFDSAYYGEKCTMSIENGQLIITRPKTSAPDEEEKFMPIGTVAYREVHIKTLSFSKVTKVQDDKTVYTDAITVTIEIADSDKNTLWGNSTSVTPFYTKVT